MVKLVRITRNGNSLTVVIPKPICRELGIRKGQLAAVGVESGRIVVCRVNEQKLILPKPESA